MTNTRPLSHGVGALSALGSHLETSVGNLSKRQKELYAKRRQRLACIAEKFETMNDVERLFLIPFGQPPSEFEIQAFLYLELKKLGFVVRGEVATKCGTCVFDIVVYQSEKPVRILEVKKYRKPVGATRIDKRKAAKSRADQLARYSAFGVPVDLVCTISNAKEYVENVRMHGFEIQALSQ